MRASEIRLANDYAVTGRDIQLARVTVLGRTERTSFLCQIQAGEVYVGWKKEHGALDMKYAGPDEIVTLTSREILRTWDEEMARRSKVLNQRETIRTAMSEMDRLLTDLGLPDAQMQLVQHPYGYLAVTVLGIEDVRRLHEKATAVDPEGVGRATGRPGPAPTGPEIPPSP